MGVALAREAYRRGATVTLVHGPLGFKPFLPSAVTRKAVLSAEEMSQVMIREVYGSSERGRGSEPHVDIAIMAAAVADFRPKDQAEFKLKKANGTPPIELSGNPDILSELGELRGVNGPPFLVGFAVETGNPQELVAEAKAKLARKMVDVVIANQAEVAFEGDENRVWIVSEADAVLELPLASKKGIAQGIWNSLSSMLQEVQRVKNQVKNG